MSTTNGKTWYSVLNTATREDIWGVTLYEHQLKELDTRTESEIYLLPKDQLNEAFSLFFSAIVALKRAIATKKRELKQETSKNEELALRRQVLLSIQSNSQNDDGIPPANTDNDSEWQTSLSKIRALEHDIELLTESLPKLQQSLAIYEKARSARPKSTTDVFAWAKIQWSLRFDKSGNNARDLKDAAVRSAAAGNFANAIYLLEVISKDDFRHLKQAKTWPNAVLCLETLGRLAVAYEKAGMYHKALQSAEAHLSVLDQLTAIGTTSAWSDEHKSEPAKARPATFAHISRLQKRLGRAIAAQRSLENTNEDTRLMANEEWFDSLKGELLTQDIYKRPGWTVNNDIKRDQP